MTIRAARKAQRQQDTLRDLGQRIVRLRTARGWSRADLAEKLGISPERLKKWEHGKNAPPITLLEPLARVLGVTLDELVTGEPWSGVGLSAEDRVIAAICLDQLSSLLCFQRADGRDAETESESSIDLPGHGGPEA